MGWLLDKLGKGVKNLGNAAGDLVNNPLKAINDGLNDEATLTTLAVLAGGYGAYEAGAFGGSGAVAGGSAGGGAGASSGAFVPGFDALGAGAEGAGIGGSAGAVGASGAFVPGADAMGIGSSAAGIPSAGGSSLLGSAGKYLTSAGGAQTLGNIAGTLYGANAAGNAAKAQADAARYATDIGNQQFAQTRADMEPWRQSGIGALAQINKGTAAGGDFNRNFTATDFQADPGYQFRMDQGRQGLERSAAARGGLLNGGTLKALNRYGQDYASNEFGNAYNRWNNDTTSRYNRLSSIAGLGQTTASQVAGYGAQNAANAGNNAMQAGNATASGYIGRANAIQNGLQNQQSMYTLNRLFPQAPGG
jgi:hypothetical protein